MLEVVAPGLAHQVADALLEAPGQRQDHLDVGVDFGGEPAELLHGALLVNLVSFLQSDSPYSFILWREISLRLSRLGEWRVATFYELPDDLPIG